MVYFDVYDVSGMNEQQLAGWMARGNVGAEKVGMGLSPGEVRQSLYVRFYEDIVNREDISAINRTLSEHLDISINPTLFDTINGKHIIIKDIDNLLYLIDDSDLLGEWAFSNEIIYIAEES